MKLLRLKSLILRLAIGKEFKLEDYRDEFAVYIEVPSGAEIEYAEWDFEKKELRKFKPEKAHLWSVYCWFRNNPVGSSEFFAELFLKAGKIEKEKKVYVFK